MTEIGLQHKTQFQYMSERMKGEGCEEFEVFILFSDKILQKELNFTEKMFLAPKKSKIFIRK